MPVNCCTDSGAIETMVRRRLDLRKHSRLCRALGFAADFFQSDLDVGQSLDIFAGLAGVAQAMEAVECFLFLAFGKQPPRRSDGMLVADE